MALTVCPECNQQVSTEAVTCPHCGKRLLANAPTPGGGPGIFVPGAAPGPEQTVWEGQPSVALVYGKLVWLIIRFLIAVVAGYLAITSGLPALASISPETRTFVDQNGNILELGIVLVLAFFVFPTLLGLLQALARIRNTHYKVTNQRIVIESGVFSRSLEEIDMRMIDDIEFQQTFVERLFGIGEVFIVSTDKVAPKFRLHGIHDPLKTRELIRTHAYQVSQRQLFTRTT